MHSARQRSGKRLAVLIAFYVLIAIAIGYALALLVKEPFLNVAELDVRTYLDNANSLRGNRYRCTGSVDSSLAWSPMSGRLYSILVGEGEPAELVPVLVPPEFNHLNVQRGQTYQFSLRVVEDGILLVNDMRKK
jgi:hypothetical protein